MAAAEHRFVVVAEEDGLRLDRFLAAKLPDLSRSYIQKLAREGRVAVDSRTSRPAQAVRTTQVVILTIPEPVPTVIEPEAIPLEILYEDCDLVVLNKRAGMVVHPGAGSRRGTLVHALLARGEQWSTIGGEERPGIVHRLDRGTSGVMLVARNDRAHRGLSTQFRDRTVEKTYLALVWGSIHGGRFQVDAPLGRDRVHRKRISSRTSHPRSASTEFFVRERYTGFTLVEARPKTGRTHQIRAHLKSVGHPIVGDAEYGGDRWRGTPPGPLQDRLAGLKRFALHALRLSFTHPRTSERMTFEAPVPPELDDLIRALPIEGRG